MLLTGILRYLAYITLLFCSSVVTLFFYVQYNIRRIHRSPLHNLPGPPSPGWLGTHLTRLLNMSICEKETEKLVKTYGHSFRYQGVGPYDERLFTLDPTALDHILTKTAIYHKPWHSRQVCGRLLGQGLVVAEGDVHKRQRKVSLPAFSQQNLNAMLPVFFAKATELRDRFLGLVYDEGPRETKVDVFHWVSRVTFDIIGITGFDYDFKAIRNETNEVYLAYRHMFEEATYGNNDVVTTLGMQFPILWKILPTKRNRIINKSLRIIREKGLQLVQGKKRALVMRTGQGRDLLSLLLKSNMSTHIPDGQKISDEDLFNQISTFLFAGSDTTSLGVSWTLYLLALHPEIQKKLRHELHELHNTFFDPSLSREKLPIRDSAGYVKLWSELEKLPLLDMVLRETLRFIPPVHSLLRVATQDDVIPVSEPIRMRDGTIRSTIGIMKGQMVHIPIQSSNLDKDIWGPTAWEFNPYRWRSVPPLVKKQLGVYSDLLTFSCGPRSCIGLRYSEMEMKILLFTLVTSLSFSNPDNIVKRSLIVTRPFVRGRIHEGSKCPMLVRPVSEEVKMA